MSTGRDGLRGSFDSYDASVGRSVLLPVQGNSKADLYRRNHTRSQVLLEGTLVGLYFPLPFLLFFFSFFLYPS